MKIIKKIIGIACIGAIISFGSQEVQALQPTGQKNDFQHYYSTKYILNDGAVLEECPIACLKDIVWETGNYYYTENGQMTTENWMYEVNVPEYVTESMTSTLIGEEPMTMKNPMNPEMIIVITEQHYLWEYYDTRTIQIRTRDYEPETTTNVVETTLQEPDETTTKGTETTNVETTENKQNETTSTQEVSKNVKPAAVKIKTIGNTKKKAIVIKWKKADNAKKYRIQYSTDKNFKKFTSKTSKKLNFTIKKLKKGKTYYVRVCAVNGNVSGAWSKRKKVVISK